MHFFDLFAHFTNALLVVLSGCFSFSNGGHDFFFIFSFFSLVPAAAFRAAAVAAEFLLAAAAESVSELCLPPADASLSSLHAQVAAVTARSCFAAAVSSFSL